MRTSILNNAVVLVALFSAKVVNGGHDGIFVEQESISTASLTAQLSASPSEAPAQITGASASATAVPSTAQVSGSIESSTSASEFASSTRSPSSHKPARASSTTHDLPASTSSLVSHPTAVNGTIAKHHDPLPLQPEITPALGIAGAILIGTGLVYALIGIKNKWLHIFLSTAYLTSLSVTVLIVYVMNPPIRNSIQGAYFIAVFFTGLVFGGCSLIFQDVTEGLGCLLGGYCVSMWLLTLKPGGLLESTSSKAIFIAVFTVATYALSFSHHTRPYGLIGSTSFAGATAIVLGIDCFSRAGLKEFWLYLWALNDNLFPLDTNTYPITRGMRVEIASIIIIFLVGIISQVKLWKVIKDRREKKNAVRLEDERHRDQMEETVGRRLEEGTNRERAQWEAVYGERDQRRRNTDSGIGTEEVDTPRKGSISALEVREVSASTDGIEMETLNDPRKGPVDKRSSTTEANLQPGATLGEGAGTVNQSCENGLGVVPPTQSAPKRGSSIKSSNLVTSKPGSKHVSIAEEPEEVTVKESDDSAQAVPPPPVVIPLPFTVPTAEGSDRDTDKSSIATFAESDEGPERHSKRRSDRSIFKRLSGRNAKGVSQSEEALIIPYADRSRASSEAATVEDDASSRRLSLKDTPPRSEEECRSRVKSPVPVDQEICQTAATQALPESNGETSLSLSTDPAKTNAPLLSNGDLDVSEFPKPPESPNNFQGLSLTPSTNPPKLKAEDLNDGPTEKQEAPTDIPAPQGSHAKSEKTRSRASSEHSARDSLKAQAVEQLPSQVSKVVMSYRTNEWAKHLSAADPPELDPLDGTITDEPATTLLEPVAPVAVEELKQTALNALPPPAGGDPSQLQGLGPEQMPLSRSTSNMSNSSPHEQRPRPSVTGETLPSRTPSQISLANGRSTANPTPQSQLQPQISTRGLRSSSSNLIASPIEENVEATYPPRNAVSPIPTGGHTLMAQRDSRVRNKYSPTALNVGPSDPNLQLAGDTSFYNNPSRSSLQFQSPTSMDDDNISLSQRRELLHSRPSSAQAISAPPLQTRLSSQYSSFDSHQPQRQYSAADPHKREAMLATWRESMRHDVATTATPEATVEQRRADMLLEKHQDRLGKQHQEVERKYRDEAIDQAMRRRDMMEAHKEAMRRMQASANKHV